MQREGAHISRHIRTLDESATSSPRPQLQVQFSMNQLKGCIPALENYLMALEVVRDLAESQTVVSLRPQTDSSLIAKIEKALEALSRSTMAYADAISARRASQNTPPPQDRLYSKVLCAAANTYLAYSRSQTNFFRVIDQEFRSINKLVGSYFVVLASSEAKLSDIMERSNSTRLSREDRYRNERFRQELSDQHCRKLSGRQSIVDLAMVEVAASVPLALETFFTESLRFGSNEQCLIDLHKWRKVLQNSSMSDFVASHPSGTTEIPLVPTHKSTENLGALVKEVLQTGSLAEMPSDPFLDQQSLASRTIRSPRVRSKSPGQTAPHGSQPTRRAVKRTSNGEASLWRSSLVSELDTVASRLRQGPAQPQNPASPPKDECPLVSRTTSQSSGTISTPPPPDNSARLAVPIPIIREGDYRASQITDASSVHSSLLRSSSSTSTRTPARPSSILDVREVIDWSAQSNWNVPTSIKPRKSVQSGKSGRSGLKSILGSLKKLKKSKN